MKTETTEPLARQSWIEDFLVTKGFDHISPGTFSNGTATIQFDGNKMIAQGGSGDRAWSSKLEDADSATVKLLLEQILKSQPFRSETDLVSERIEKQRVNEALAGIAKTIQEGPDTHSGVQLRRFLWSLYNGHHLVNLWQMTCVLDSQCSGWTAEICASTFDGVLREEDLKRALHNAGEMERWDQVIPSTEHLNSMVEAERAVESVLRTLPPSRGHTELNRVREALWEAQKAIRRAKELPNGER